MAIQVQKVPLFHHLDRSRIYQSTHHASSIQMKMTHADMDSVLVHHSHHFLIAASYLNRVLCRDYATGSNQNHLCIEKKTPSSLELVKSTLKNDKLKTDARKESMAETLAACLSKPNIADPKYRRQLRQIIRDFQTIDPSLVSDVLYISKQRLLKEGEGREDQNQMEETWARLLEISILQSPPNHLKLILIHFCTHLSDWKYKENWFNIIKSLIGNLKTHHSSSSIKMLSSLPIWPILNYEIEMDSSDLIHGAQKVWWEKINQKYPSWIQANPSRSSSIQDHSTGFFTANEIALLIHHSCKDHEKPLEKSVEILGHLCFDHWIDPHSLNSIHSYPLSQVLSNPSQQFLNAIFFSIIVIATLVRENTNCTRKEIARVLNMFNGQVIHFLNQNCQFIDTFNTFEYLEWVAILIAETAKRRGKHYQDFFMIRDALNSLLDGWDKEDIERVSNAISKRFTLERWIREAVQEWKTKP